MERGENNKLLQIILATAFLIVAIMIKKNGNLSIWENFLVFLIPYLISGFDVIKDALENILKKEFFDEDFLMTVATVGAMCIGFLPNTNPEFAEAVFVMLLFQVGELFEEIAEGKSEKSIKSLINIRPDYAYIDKNGNREKVDPKTVKVDDIIIISPGEKVPMDGIIIKGKTSLNTVALTGESVPRSAKEGDIVNSGCVNLNGQIKVKVTNTFENSTASKIIDLVENAVDHKSKSENFITKFSKIYTPVVVGIAIVLAFLPPILSGNFSDSFANWLARALTFLVVSCPCALVISVPLSFFGGIGGASKKRNFDKRFKLFGSTFKNKYCCI